MDERDKLLTQDTYSTSLLYIVTERHRLVHRVGHYVAHPVAHEVGHLVLLTKVVNGCIMKLTTSVNQPSSKEVTLLNPPYERFISLEREKQDRIVNAAFEVFAKSRFQKASTNAIVEKAGISKGILFHYFKTKQDLYDYLKHFAFSAMIKAIETELDWTNSDFFERLKAIGIIKTKILVQYPYMASFIQILHEELGMDELYALVQTYSPELMQDVYTKNMDYSKFKADVDFERILNMTQWTFEKLGEVWFKRHKPEDPWDYEGLAKDSDAYIALLRQTFYKPEVL